ncbi:MAG: MBL fold metallo-hydrolase [Clostridiaceae bacterium]|nr:MBL fold metallo-hydrolase [Clostridiaceae bacterium]
MIIALITGACLWYFKFGGKSIIDGWINSATVDDGGGESTGNGENNGGENNGGGESTGNGEVNNAGAYLPAAIENGDLSIHFLELGNKNTGDSVYIKNGDTDILIDAGSKNNSGPVISDYIDDFVTDNKLEFVIATHAHEDHIAGFYSSSSNTGVFARFETGIIIDFPLTESTTGTYTNYVKARDAEVTAGAKHYTALECYNESKTGAKRVYDLGGGTELEILYSYYYEHDASTENNYSVAVMINQGDKHYIFTGDMEKDAEDKMVEYYDNYRDGLPKCVLYKGGHHGSQTSSNVKLLEAIQPEYVAICTCVGSSEYKAKPDNVFPSKDFIDRISKYTDRVYATTIVTNYAAGEFEPLNGTIVILTRANEIYVRCTNNNKKLKETDWFRDNREMPAAWAA